MHQLMIFVSTEWSLPCLVNDFEQLSLNVLPCSVKDCAALGWYPQLVYDRVLCLSAIVSFSSLQAQSQL